MAGIEVLTCVFGCVHGVDKLEHYAVCAQVWPFLQRARPGGLGIDGSMRSLDGFLLSTRGIADNDKMAMAVGIYAVSRAVAQSRQHAGPIKVEDLLRLHAREGLRGSKAKRLLAAHSNSFS